ncbi:hypothetical protein PC121_g11 [Phytophthora cactorum]|nr:hypothetical protein PC121_g11 [Phytophthora cactorum]
MQTRGQQRHPSLHMAQFLDLAEETKAVLLELGAILNQRYRNRGPSHQTQRSLQRKNEAVSRLEQFIIDQRRVCEREERVEQDSADLKATTERLEKQLEDQRADFDQERERLQQQATSTLTAQADLNSSLTKVLPQLRGLLDAFDREQGQHLDLRRDTTTRTVTITGETCSNQALTRRLIELQTAFDEERAHLLEQASDAAKMQQDISHRNLTEREAALTCPISLDLFENPVLTTCCGKTFSSEALTQALRRNPHCPVCRAHRVSTHSNRDVANLVELHRSERSLLGLPENAAATSSTIAPNVDERSMETERPTVASGGGEQDRRVNFLEQQIKDLEQHLRNECETSVKRQFQLMQQVADLGKRLQLKEAATNYLQQQLNEALGAYRAQRQRADQLQLESGSKAEQNQREQALREHIQRQEQQIREQQAALSECTSRSFEQQKIHERLQRSAELLEMRREDENVVSAEERAHLDDQLAEVQQQSDVLSDTCNQEGSDAALQNDTDEGQNPMTSTNSDESADQVLSVRLNELLCNFEQERAQLLEQASNAAATQQNTILVNRSHREAALTCSISRDLFVDPVVTECCDKTFSSQALMQSLERSPICPICRGTEVRIHPNRDMSILVQLHRSEYTILGNLSPNEPARSTDDATITTEQSDIPAGRGRRSRRDRMLIRFKRLKSLQQRRQVLLEGRNLGDEHVLHLSDPDLMRCQDRCNLMIH